MPYDKNNQFRVLIAADTYPPHVNGAAKSCFRLATELTAKDYDVHIVAPHHSSGADTVETYPEATVHRLKSLPAPTHEYYRLVMPWHAKRAIDRLIGQLDPDVVHAQCHYMIGEAAINSAEARRIRLICTNHFMPENLDPFIPGPQFFKNFVSSRSWYDMGRLMSKANIVTTPTPLSAANMSHKARLEYVVPVSNGIDVAKYERQEGEHIQPHEHPTALFVGRLAVEKNVDVLLKALTVTDPELNVHAEIIGDGEQRDYLRDLAVRLGIQNRVVFRGLVSDEDLREAYLRADVFTQPCTAELQSLASLEAMSASTPVVLADALALPHLVTEGVNGYLFEPYNPQDMAAKMNLVLGASPDKKAAMGHASHAFAAKHAHEKVIDVVEQMYHGATSDEVAVAISGSELR
ncbi:glycosyltransferase [Enteractinococcus coprophilus]|uniref:D-inositol 3-phosphate glycosyltransferase n=1 Tax=Enteractinococcus coprophilus TaxID=1027633 RepID=A0A543AF20_9MICC|nr:glycosyltransferase [Enteractinococcus coprophilus]TQL71178.1 glycosyltransferase involved in cell wall biosynthesis [Enteractinococcus coprophilus]